MAICCAKLPAGLRRLGGPVGAALLALSLSAISTGSACAGGTLTVAMTAGDIPVTTGNPDQGFEGYRFVGYNLYDALLLWDLSKSDKPSEPKPGLATSYEIDPSDHMRWIVHLREDVSWHDGCKFNADDVVWNFQMRMDQHGPNFSPQQFTYTRAFLSNVKAVTKLDDHTIAIENNFPESLFPYTLTYVLMISPCRAKEVNYDWAQYALHPSGTGPYKFDRFVPHQRLEFVPNAEYWDKTRIPKQERLVLIPMPEASTRTAALLTGQVNWIEAPSPDAIPRLKSAGMSLVTNVYPHDWPYLLNFARGPFKDLRVRQAANYAINRQDVVDLLGGTAIPEHDVVPPSMAYYGHPATFDYDPQKARALLTEAGCLPCKIKFGISTSGSGQMQPLPMNELVKAQLEEVGFEVTLQSMDWNALLDVYRAGVDKFPEYDGLNFSRGLLDPVSAIIKLVGKTYWAPKGPNWGHYENPEAERLIGEIFNEFDEEKRLVLLTQLHEFEGRDAVMIFVVHDLNPRAMSPKVEGFVQAQSWFQDLTPVTVSP
ncbi:MAG: ABC transporter substrate-binding protein [Alphaproteobacteria bacterium]|nr:ABC transporter substrate-binding protein [Alphaproteobacteria bacterium]